MNRANDRVCDSMEIEVWNHVEDRLESRLEDLVYIPIWFRLFNELNLNRKTGVS